MTWDCFVILGGMRTGSNYLESNLNEYEGLTCLGELFNPYFIGHANRAEAHGMTLAERDADPMALIRRIRDETAGLAGFRLFHDHDPRVLAAVLDDPRVAKIVLTRNPVESYVSLKIVRETGQWRLADMKNARQARIRFDPDEFAAHLAAARAFHDRILRRLQETGQTAFFLTYEDVGEAAVMNGLARWLGSGEMRKATSTRTKKQNPEPLEDKVLNHAEMEAALAGVDWFGLGRAPVFEPRRGPAVAALVAAARAPLIFVPIAAGPEAAVRAWLAALDGVEDSGLLTGFNGPQLRAWRTGHVPHRSFAVLRHPLARLHRTFLHLLRPAAQGPFLAARRVIARTYKVELEGLAPDPAAHRRAFKAFLGFVHGNLSGQTALPAEAAWATQTAILQGMGAVLIPDRLLREEELARGLAGLADELGLAPLDWRPEDEPESEPEGLPTLAEIRDGEIEARARKAHLRDYLNFGFGPWKGGDA